MEEMIKAIEALIDKKLAEYTKNFNENTIPFIAGFSFELTSEIIKAEKVIERDFTQEDISRVYVLMEKLKNFKPREIVPMYLKGIIDNTVKMYEMGDAPSCPTCGSIMVRAGSCHSCKTCGSTSGCS